MNAGNAPSPFRLIAFILSVVLLAGAAYCFSSETYSVYAVTLELAALACALISSCLIPLDLSSYRTVSWSRLDFLLALALSLLALIVRIPFVSTAPPGAFFDEAQNIKVAKELLGGNLSLYIGDATQMPAGFFYLLAGFLALTGDSIASARAFSGLLGSVSVGVFYLYARLLFSREAAFTGAIFFLGSRWHLNFSRVAFVGISTPLLEMLSLGALMLGMRTRKTLWLVLAGLISAFGLYTYYAFNIFLPVLAGAALLMYFQDSRENRHRLHHGLLFGAAAFICLLAPLAIYAALYPEVFFQRSGVVAIWKHAPMPDGLYQNLRSYAGMFHVQGDSNPRHNLPDAPMLNMIEGALMTLGIGAALGRALPFGLTILLWFVVMLVPGILTFEAPQGYRTVGVLPAVYLLITFAAAHFQVVVQRLRLTRISLALLCIVALISARQNFATYFEKQVKDVRTWQAFDGDSRAVAEFVHSLPLETVVRANPPFLGPTFDLFSGRPADEVRFLVRDEFSSQATTQCGKDYIFILDEFQSPLLDAVQDESSNSTSLVHPRSDGSMSFLEVRVPKRQCEADASRGLRARFFAGKDITAIPQIDRVDRGLAYHFHDHREALPKPFSVIWSGLINVENEASYSFEVASTGAAVLRIDGATVLDVAPQTDPDAHLVSVSLPRGPHCIELQYVEDSYQAKIRLRWMPPNHTWSLIPAHSVTPALCQDASQPQLLPDQKN